MASTTIRRVTLAAALTSMGGLLARAAAADPALRVAGSERCSVSLVRLSYDDPDADDAELLELFVEGAPESAPVGPAPHSTSTPSSPVPSPCDSGDADGAHPAQSADAATSVDAPTRLTLGDCGLFSLELVNGGSGACESYRTLSLGEVVVPGDGYVVLCADDSALAATGACDVMSAGRSTLKNGWLQNGPNDGLRFSGADGATPVTLGYEGGPACFGSTALRLADETGTMTDTGGAPVDDVGTLCGDAYVLRPMDLGELRSPPRCAVEAIAGADGGVAPALDGAPAAASGAGGAPWTPEFAPPVKPDAPPFGAFDVDAGLVAAAKESAPAPSPPGCAVAGHDAHRGRLVPTWVLVAAATAAVRRRRAGSRRPTSRG